MIDKIVVKKDYVSQNLKKWNYCSICSVMMPDLLLEMAAILLLNIKMNIRMNIEMNVKRMFHTFAAASADCSFTV